MSSMDEDLPVNDSMTPTITITSTYKKKGNNGIDKNKKTATIK